MNRRTVETLVELIHFLLAMLTCQSHVFPVAHLEELRSKSRSAIEALEQELLK